MPESAMTTDHPGWEISAGGRPARLARTAAGVWSATWNGARVNVCPLPGADGEPPTVLTASAADLPPRVPSRLREELGRLGTVHRLTNPWLWDAITTAVLRQVVRAAQARALYQRWSAAHGMSVANERAKLALPPGPETVLALPDSAFADVGAAFHRTALTAAAEAYLELGATWATLPPPELASALDAVPRIGPWTARAAAADFTGDFSIYPCGDLAVRTWATRAAPEHLWPQGDRAFETAWRALADTPQHLHTLTLLTLTWGSHASTQPDPPPQREH
jgi:3-methyladenine DNA glycosylase/8-oxoguanine DNA glycosylase